MPAIFYGEAFQAAVGEKPLEGIGDEHFTNGEKSVKLVDAPDRLSPEQRCDALYADWLLQLHNPAHQAERQFRDLLIGQGALAADNLAALAQNPDDGANEPGVKRALNSAMSGTGLSGFGGGLRQDEQDAGESNRGGKM
jgi:hypothetical protein